uniref:Mitogen-activated protein kinase organizer 1 n=1 Tax=Panagrolaimus sp. JU765 TaxID=591449 RepID=A0AC34Q7W7_9BILA
MMKQIPNKLVHSFSCQQGALRTVRFNSNGSYCLTGGVDKTVGLWNPYTATLLHSFSGCGGEVRAVAGSNDNSMIAAGGTDKIVTIFNVETGKSLKRYRGHTAWINSLFFNEESSLVFSAGQEGTVYIWDLRDRNEIVQVMEEANDAVLSLDIKGSEVLTGSADHKMRHYDIRNGWLSITDAGESVTDVHISEDKQSLLMASMKSPIKVIDKNNGRILAEYSGHKNDEFKVECGILYSNEEIVTGSEDGYVYIFDYISKKIIGKLDHLPAKYVHSLTIHPKKNVLISISRDRLFLWINQDDQGLYG